MADELKGALDQINTDVAAITGVQDSQLGQRLNVAEATKDACNASVYLAGGRAMNDAYTSTKGQHRVEIRLYWLLTPYNEEVVEQSMATMWDRVMTKFFGDDADRNLTESATIALVSGEDGTELYQAGYEEINAKMHRVLIIPVEVELDTHSV